jgi:hypothetical protein
MGAGDAGYADCDDGAGGETSVNTLQNCGGCGQSCGVSHASSTQCVAYECKPVCNAGFANCYSSHAGCETTLGTVDNCIACGDTCSGAKPYCTAGGCSATP